MPADGVSCGYVEHGTLSHWQDENADSWTSVDGIFQSHCRILGALDVCIQGCSVHIMMSDDQEDQKREGE